MPPSSRVLALGIAWLTLVVLGLAALARYSYTPGDSGIPGARFPTGSPITSTSGRATLVLLAHPQCPCSRASIEELSKLMAHATGRLDAHVLFLRPDGFAAGWEHTDLWDSAARIPGVRAWADPDGVEIRRFGAVTSGQVLVYNPAGALIFSGGITAARGHAGDNLGPDTILTLLRGGKGDRNRTAVFGCSLRTPHGSS